MKNYYLPLNADNYYHIFNRAIGYEKSFCNDENYNFFLRKLSHYICPVADILAYSLLPNHFHLLVKIHNEQRLLDVEKSLRKNPEGLEDLQGLGFTASKFVMQQFSNLLNSYTKAFNKMYNRKGSLFIDHLRRSEAETNSDITSFLFYVHKNPVHHGLTKTIGEWKYDSYNSILSNKPTKLARKEVIEWFGCIEQFIAFHQQPVLKKVDFIDI